MIVSYESLNFIAHYELVKLTVIKFKLIISDYYYVNNENIVISKLNSK